MSQRLEDMTEVSLFSFYLLEMHVGSMNREKKCLVTIDGKYVGGHLSTPCCSLQKHRDLTFVCNDLPVCLLFETEGYKCNSLRELVNGGASEDSPAGGTEAAALPHLPCVHTPHQGVSLFHTPATRLCATRVSHTQWSRPATWWGG